MCLPRQSRDRFRTLNALCFICPLVYNMMCVACCVHLCVIEYIHGRLCMDAMVEKYNLRGSER